MCHNVHECAKVNRNVQAFKIICENVRECVYIKKIKCKECQKMSRMCKNLLEYAKMI